MSEYPYVQLERRFVDIGASDPEDDPTAGLLLRARRQKPGIGWEELLGKDAAVILGSAGSGKTTEILEEARRLREKGKQAFVFRMESLCRQPLEKSFFPDDAESRISFSKWLGGNDGGVAFIDALDEARLPDAKNESVLVDALSTLSQAVGRSGTRLKIIITTRGSEWRGKPDLDLVIAAVRELRGAEEKKTREVEVGAGVYRITSLDVDDIHAIADSRGVDPDKFITTVNRSLAANIVRQPLEVHFLVDIWLEEVNHGKEPDEIFTSRERVFHSVISSRLRTEQSGERRSDLDPIQARWACEKLAAATVLSEVRDISPTGHPEGALSALDILANDGERWSERDVRQVLSCALFHPSFAGRIRFAHREIQDYLAACFFDRAIQENAGSLEVISPLIAKGLGASQVPQSTEQVIGWLATLNPIARIYITQLKPALLIEAGDPRSLSLEERAKAIEAQVTLYEGRSYRGEWFYRDDIERFASPDLASVVGKFLIATTAPEVRKLLVEIARYGRMVSLVELLANIARDETEQLRVRSEACFALAEFVDIPHAFAVLSAYLSAFPPDHDDTDAASSWNLFAASVLTYTYPMVATLSDVVWILQSMRREARNHYSSTSRYLGDWVLNLDSERAVELLPRLLRAAAGEREAKNYQLPRPIERFLYLAPAICQLITKLLGSDQDMAKRELVLDGLEYLFAVHSHRHAFRSDMPFHELATVLLPAVEIKTALIDRRCSFLEVGEKSEQSVAFNVMHPLKLSDDQNGKAIFSFTDVEAACLRIVSATSQRERRMAYELVRDICVEVDDLEKRKKAFQLVRKAVVQSGDRKLIVDTSVGLRKRLNGLVFQVRHVYWYRYERRLHQLKHFPAATYWKARNLTLFLVKRRGIVGGDEKRILEWQAGRSLNDPGRKAVDDVKAAYGSVVAAWFEMGFRAYWRQHEIKPADYRTYSAIAAGLAGLALDAERGAILATADEARNAFGYAFCNLNSFPDWALALVETHTNSFFDVFAPILKEELTRSLEEPDHASSGLSHVVYAGLRIREIVAPILWREFQAHVPQKRSDLELIVQTLARTMSIDKKVVSDFFLQEFERASTEFDFALAWIWLDGLFVVDAEAAWSALTKALGTDWTGAAARLFVNFIGRERRHFSRAEERASERDDLPNNAKILGGLVKASFLAWPPDKDIRHEDVYSPGQGERASDQRRYFLDWLVQSNSPEALQVVDGLIADPSLATHLETFLYSRDRIVRGSARRPKFSPSQTAEFLNSFSKSPTTVQEFRVLVQRYLQTLLQKLAHSDDDEGAVFRSGKGTEYDLRNWLAGRLREVGGKYFTVVREQEVASAKRPDLRIHARRLELGNISIEIKLADRPNWTGDILLDKVKSQLADQYLNEPVTHTGYYLLANTAPFVDVRDKLGKVLRHAFSKEVAGKHVSFDELVTMAKERAAAVSGSLGGNKMVDIISVSFYLS